MNRDHIAQSSRRKWEEDPQWANLNQKDTKKYGPYFNNTVEVHGFKLPIDAAYILWKFKDQLIVDTIFQIECVLPISEHHLNC